MSASRLLGPKPRQIWRYFHECHQRMNTAVHHEIFHSDFILNHPNGSQLDLPTLIRTNEELWSILKPGTLKVQLEFHDYDFARIPKAAAQFPPDDLQLFTGTFQAERVEPNEQGETTLHHQVQNLWRFQQQEEEDGSAVWWCMETWPMWEQETNSEDLLKLIQQVGGEAKKE